MKKVLIFFSMLFLFSLIGCGSNQKVLKVGFASTLTGQYAYIGNYELYAVQYAVEEINAAGGINGMQIELVIKDDQADPEVAVAVDNELIEEGVNIVIGHGFSFVAESISENAKDKEILFLSPSIGTDDLSGLDDYFVRNVSTTYYEAKAIVESIAQDNPEKVLLVYNLDNYSLTKYHKQGFETGMTDMGYTIDDYETVEFYSNNAEEISIIESKISSGDFDTIMLACSNADAASIINYIDINNVDIDIHVTSWGAQGLLSLISSSDSDTINAYFAYVEKSNDADFESFKAGYEEKYSVELQMVAVNSYDLVYMLKSAIEHADSIEISEVKSAILEIGSFAGIAGDYTINEFGDCIRQTYRMNILDGEYVLRSQE